MAKGGKEPTARERRPWDRPSWPAEGDRTLDAVYAAVGGALSEWERYEAVLSYVFAGFTTPTEVAIGRRTYSAVRTFEGRAEMLRAASEAYFTKYPNAKLLTQFKDVLRAATAFAPRRNDIAHGSADHYRRAPPAPLEIPAPDRYALFPAFASFRERDMSGTPSYCYTSAEIEYFRGQFLLLRRPARDLADRLIVEARKRASFDKFRSLYRSSANPTPDQNDQPESERPPEPSQE